MEVQIVRNKENRISDQDQPDSSHQINREYKDRLFCKVFEDKKDLLELYNAVNSTDYNDPEALEVNTGLFYFSRLYEGYVEGQNIRIYGRTQIRLPTPQYVIFYNGTEEEPDCSVLRLSDAFAQKGGEPALECRAVMLNINYGHNKDLMQKCRKLKEYAFFVALVRKKLSDEKARKKAVAEAVDECINKGILRDILVKNRAEVIGMILTNFDQEEYEKTIRDESYKEGVQQGVEQGMEQGIRLGQTDFVVTMLKNGFSPEEIKKYTGASDEVIRQAQESTGK